MENDDVHDCDVEKKHFEDGMGRWRSRRVPTEKRAIKEEMRWSSEGKRTS